MDLMEEDVYIIQDVILCARYRKIIILKLIKRTFKNILLIILTIQ